ncbi:HSF_DOMAIN domain-containing protein [Caerostris darwini]|uniref:HSF_DOMAIN domain-containing protein n=1 Tax=Caerostris darwini TaxID=1538125 RepID=A0AAV4Q055_9ARAC|nr:HSF_DOMAIN domain-containing protein [Caerostris darwini]
MISKELAASLKGTSFPHKLHILATSSEIASIRWSKSGNHVLVDSIGIKEELFHPQIFNVKSNQHVLRQLAYYNFQKIDHKSRIWEFKHRFFKAGRKDLLQFVKRQTQKSLKFQNKFQTRIAEKLLRSEWRRRGFFESDEDAEIDYENPVMLTSPQRKRRRMMQSHISPFCPFESKLQIAESPFDRSNSEEELAIPSSKESDTNQSLIDNGFILNNSVATTVDLKPFNATNKFIIENTTNQILAEYPSDRFYIKPDGKNILLEIRVLNGTLYHNTGRKRIRETVETVSISDRLFVDSCPLFSYSNQYWNTLSTENNFNSCLPIKMGILENGINEIQKISRVFDITRHKNSTDDSMQRNSPQSHIFRANTEAHFDHEYPIENLSRSEMGNLGRNNNTIDFDHRFYNQDYQDFVNVTDSGNTIRKFHQWDAKNDSFEKYQNLNCINTVPNTEIAASQADDEIPLDSLYQTIKKLNSDQNSSSWLPNFETIACKSFPGFSTGLYDKCSEFEQGLQNAPHESQINPPYCDLDNNIFNDSPLNGPPSLAIKQEMIDISQSDLDEQKKFLAVKQEIIDISQSDLDEQKKFIELEANNFAQDSSTYAGLNFYLPATNKINESEGNSFKRSMPENSNNNASTAATQENNSILEIGSIPFNPSKIEKLFGLRNQ